MSDKITRAEIIEGLPDNSRQRGANWMWAILHMIVGWMADPKPRQARSK